MHPDNAAYVMYTSGSTGVPKGVTITHRNIAACLPSLVAAVGLEPGGRVLAGTSVNFDVSVFEIMTALTTGATVDVVRDVLELGERDDWQGTVVSIQVVSRARARGVEVTPREVFQHRTVAELARVAAGRGGAAETLEELAGGGIGFVPLLPVARYLLELGGGYGRFTMSSVVDLPAGIDRAGLVATLSAVWDRHDLLRSRLVEGGLEVGAPGSVDVAALVERVAVDRVLGCGLVRAGRA
ncbi:D-alanine--D-alanyl carrier protein ligase [Streptomyces violaceorubidus]